MPIAAVRTAGGFVMGTMCRVVRDIFTHRGHHVEQRYFKCVSVIHGEHPIGIFDDTIFWPVPIGLCDEQAVRGQLQNVTSARAIRRRLR